MKNKSQTIREYCSFCQKEYQSKIWGNIAGIPLTESHNCKEQKRVERARAKITYF